MRNQKAFTLIELMVTISVLGVVIGLALPGFNKLIINNKSTVLGEDLTSQINLARYEAVKRGTRISICASSNSSSATPSCTGNWTDGYMVVVDKATSDAATAPVLGAAPEIVRVFPKVDNKAVINVKNGSTDVSFIRFTSLGTLAQVGNKGALTVSAKITGCSGNKNRSITVGVTGLISAKDVGC